jgi:nucleoside-diphosphate-sugar epimerase
MVKDHYEVMDKDIVMDCSKAKKTLGWQPKVSNIKMILHSIKSYKNAK